MFTVSTGNTYTNLRNNLVSKFNIFLRQSTTVPIQYPFITYSLISILYKVLRHTPPSIRKKRT